MTINYVINDNIIIKKDLYDLGKEIGFYGFNNLR